VTEKLHIDYVCYENRSCNLQTSARKSCKYCRFQACLKAGMRPAYVHFKIKVPRPIQEQPSMHSSKLLTRKEMEDIKLWTSQSKIFDQSKIGSYDPLLRKEIIRHAMFGRSISRTGRLMFRHDLENKAISFLKRLKFFKQPNLVPLDQELILKFNTPVVAAMQASSIFYEELPWFDQLSALLGHHDAKKFQKILIEYVGQDVVERKLTYSDLYVSINHEEVERFRELQKTVSSWPQDAHEYVLMILLIAFMPNEYMNNWGRDVAKIQDSLSEILFKYLIDKHAKNSKIYSVRFAKAVENISLCQELTFLLNKK